MTFTAPSAVLKHSFAEEHKHLLDEHFVQQDFLLMSDEDTITMPHTDYTGTSVCYFLLHGRKTIFTVKPTDENLRLFDDYLEKRTRGESNNVFFTNKCLKGVSKYEIRQNQAFIMSAGTIHMVLTNESSFAIGMNFIHTRTLFGAAEAYKKEALLGVSYGVRFPMFEKLVAIKLLQECILSK